MSNVPCVDMIYSLLLKIVLFSKSFRFWDLFAWKRLTTMASMLALFYAADFDWSSMSCPRCHPYKYRPRVFLEEAPKRKQFYWIVGSTLRMKAKVKVATTEKVHRMLEERPQTMTQSEARAVVSTIRCKLMKKETVKMRPARGVTLTLEIRAGSGKDTNAQGSVVAQKSPRVTDRLVEKTLPWCWMIMLRTLKMEKI